MRLFLVIIVLSVIGLSYVGPAYAGSSLGGSSVISSGASAVKSGCGSIDRVLSLIPGAFKTIMYYEGFRFHLHKRGLKSKIKPEVKCNTNNLFDTLEKTLKEVCSLMSAVAGDTSSPYLEKINKKIGSIEDSLSDLGGAERRFKSIEDLGEFIDFKQVKLDRDIVDISDLAPKVDTNPKTDKSMGEKGWIHWKKRKQCRIKNSEVAKEVDSETLEEVSKGGDYDPKAAADFEDAAEAYGLAAARAEEARTDVETAQEIYDDLKSRYDAAVREYEDFLAEHGITRRADISSTGTECITLRSFLGIKCTKLKGEVTSLEVELRVAERRLDENIRIRDEAERKEARTKAAMEKAKAKVGYRSSSD